MAAALTLIGAITVSRVVTDQALSNAILRNAEDSITGSQTTGGKSQRSGCAYEVDPADLTVETVTNKIDMRAEPLPKNVGFLPPSSARFVPSRSLRSDSAKTCGNPVLRTARRKTDEFPVLVAAALIGGWMESTENG
jgi:hypothetical protein